MSATDQIQTASQAATGAGQQAAAPTTRQTRKRNTATRPNGSQTVTPDANHVTIAITLPKDILQWFKAQAKQAPFEPSVQKYIAWELRELSKARQAAAEDEKAMIAEAQQ